MNRLAAGLAAALLAIAPAVASPASSPAAAAHQAETERNRLIVMRFVDLFYRQKNVKRAFEMFVAPDYIQHNPNIPDGRAAAIAFLAPKFGDPAARFEVLRIIVDGDLAMVHVHGRPSADAAGGAVADIYRLKDGRIVEHWDVLQAVPEHATNPHPLF